MKIIEGFAQAKALLSRQAKQETAADGEREKSVRRIIAEVRRRGDAALFDFTEQFDGVKLAQLEVTKAEIDLAYRTLDKKLLAAMKLAAARITAYHREQQKALLVESRRGRLGWFFRPIKRVGVHVPGFSAPLPSSLLMTAVPARVAGVKEIILVTPPQKTGRVSPVTLAAAKIAKIDRVFSIGGAQAVAALAYGTASVPAVDKICGPGNAYATLAKKLVFGTVGIDGLYGPSEVIIIADETANAAYAAADLLAQAEHGAASAILIATSRPVADNVNREVEAQLKTLARRDIIAADMARTGFIAVVADVAEGLALADMYAPEHLCLLVKDAASYVKQVNNVGCLFVGENAIEALVDYAAGPSHVLPTDGTARFSSGLNIMDFVKLISLVKMNKSDMKQIGGAAAAIAKAEGLDAHARALEKRLEDAGQGGT
ncbi:MAG: histidinol dehydrogenase [Dehalococcoidales bacterium]|jgi:histidinol dehydrogenase